KPVSTKLPSKYKNILKGLKGEKLKKIKRVDDQHYYISNETRYDLWYPHIKNIGGAYVGVGPDQNYSLASIAKAKLVILMDYDYEVLSTHRLYMLFFREAEKPEDILEFFKRKHVKRFKKLAKK
ncbi:MAG: hypothetical protein PF689_04665, partial [Deltaproteobacteria bacterium]|nr:hypothetical protein [Deltaproteobacteria bacterium]